jgi:hypothetical protein
MIAISRRMQLPLAIAALAAVAWTLIPRPANAAILVTTNPAEAAAFQAGATVEAFDNLPPLTISSYASGQTVPLASQFSSRDLAAFTSPFFNSGGASFNDPVGNPGTPIGIFDPDGAIAGEVVSPNNVAGPLAGGSDQAFNFGFMEVIFPADVRRVGLWVTHGTFQLILKDSGNQNLSTGDVSVTGSAGQFIGIERDSADIRGVTMGFPESFTIDDFTYAATPVPEPTCVLLAIVGLASLLIVRRLW